MIIWRKVLPFLAVLALLVGCGSGSGQPAPDTKAPPSQTKPEEGKPAVSEEAAAIAAKNFDPKRAEGGAKWERPQLVRDMELQVNGSTEKRVIWIVEASYPDGMKLVAYVDATTGQVLLVETSVKQPAVSEEAAAIVAKNFDPKRAEGGAKWQRPRFEPKWQHGENGVTINRPVWVVEGIYSDGQKLTVFVDAVTGKAITTDGKQ